jgi:hypothetical protein
MDDVKVCPLCDRRADPDQDNCPHCGSAFTKSKPDKNTQSNTIQDNYSDPGQKLDNNDEFNLLSTKPERVSFLYRYLMALSPVFLVVLCIFVRWIIERLFHFGSSSLIAAVPGFMSSYTTGVLNQYSSPITDATNITILMIAPVGIFLFFAAIGWTMRLTELWTSTALTLGLSGVMGIIMANWSGAPAVSGNYMLLVLQWIEYLVQPFCFVSAIIVILATEKFWRSIRYTITRDGVGIRGGVWKIQEHMIPHYQIGRVVLEQDFLGARYNYGTVIPQSIARWGEETSFRGIGATGQKDNFGVGIAFAKGRAEASRYPLDCLFGIPDPKKAQKILTGLITRHDKREDEQVSYLKKIYETNAQGTPPTESVLDQINKLADLKNSGIITEQEFTAKKTELLKRL